jgi:hypothetical protein
LCFVDIPIPNLWGDHPIACSGKPIPSNIWTTIYDFEPFSQLIFSPADLKRALDEASLGQHFRVFRNQEVDLQLFLTMSDKDLAEMGILDSSHRAQLLALISKLAGRQKGATNGSSGGVAARPGIVGGGNGSV